MGQIAGGIDDRFDFQLVTNEMLGGESLSYIPGTYRVFGNNGKHPLNGEITQGAGASPTVLNALASVSDHLPVVADYQLPADLAMSAGGYPTQIIHGANV